MTNQTQAEALRLADEAWSFDASARGSTKHANAEMLCMLQDCASTIRKLVAENEPIGAAHAADYAKLQGYIGALSAAEARIAELEASRFAFASEFEPNTDGEPDVGNIHANIRALKAQAQPAREPLTDDELRTVFSAWQNGEGKSMADLCRAIERAHGITQGGSNAG